MPALAGFGVGIGLRTAKKGPGNKKWVPSAAVAQDVIEVLFKSDPPGATLFEGDRSVGTVPYRGKYAIEAADRSRGFKQIIPLEARWASGAKASLPGPPHLPVDKGPRVETTFVRPKDAPGFQIDLKLANDLAAAEQSRAQPSKSQAEEESRKNREAAAGWLGDLFEAVGNARRAQSATPPLLVPLELRCRGTGPNQVDFIQR